MRLYDDLDYVGVLKSGPEDFGRGSEDDFRHAIFGLLIIHVSVCAA